MILDHDDDDVIMLNISSESRHQGIVMVWIRR
jgi:hypothetical protein